MDIELPKELLGAHASLWSANRGQRAWSFRFVHPNREWMHDDWARVASWLRGARGFKESIGSEVLEVSSNGVTLEVHGVPSITRYCLSESPVGEGIESVWFSTSVLKEDPIAESDLMLRIDSRVEERVPATDATEGSSWEQALKHYNLRKSFSYTADDCTIVLSMVRRTPVDGPGFLSMREANVTGLPVSFSFELQIVAHGDGEGDGGDVGGVLERVMFLYQVLYNDPLPITRSTQAEVVAAYEALSGKRGFFAPKPVTLERMHLAAPGYGVQTIQEGYAVTEKADGERMLLYVHEDGEAYLINNTLEVRRTGLRASGQKMRGSVVDGEFVPCQKRRDGSPKDLFVVFDIYYLDGKSLMDLPLLAPASAGAPAESRMARAEALMSTNLWDTRRSFVDLRVKRHLPGDGEEIFALSKRILDGARDLPYEIDGLVYTPVKLGVFGFYPGRPGLITESMKWDRVLKWKPPAQNTIDFLVRRDRASDPRPNPRNLVAYRLLTGKAAARWAPISVMDGLRRRYDRDYRERIWKEGNEYRAEPFRPFSYYHEGVDTAVIPERCENGDKIEDDVVVEMTYDPFKRGPVSQRWTALRVREDKTRIYKTTHKISKTANDFSVATNIWRTIHEPVTVEMITGASAGEAAGAGAVPDDLEERLLGSDDTYYAREIPRQHMLSRAMLDFHNQGIKKMLYNIPAPSQRGALLELACGMAGDLPRWRDGLYRFVLGVDLVRDNITHPTEGSYARLLRNKLAIEYIEPGSTERRRLYPDVVFLVANISKPIHDGSASMDLDEESRKVLQILYNRNARPQEPFLQRHLPGRAAHGFNVVSCQFAIHYMFGNEALLDAFFQNVSYNLKKDGLFLATFMDGDTVHQMLEASDNGIAEGRKLNGEVATWAIIRRYDGYDPITGDVLGKRIDVFLENFGRVTAEYLVNLDLLLRKAREHGLELHSTGMFGEQFVKIKNGEVEASEKLRETVKELDRDEVQKRFSSLNRWIVLRKTDKTF